MAPVAVAVAVAGGGDCGDEADGTPAVDAAGVGSLGGRAASLDARACADGGEVHEDAAADAALFDVGDAGGFSWSLVERVRKSGSEVAGLGLLKAASEALGYSFHTRHVRSTDVEYNRSPTTSRFVMAPAWPSNTRTHVRVYRYRDRDRESPSIGSIQELSASIHVARGSPSMALARTSMSNMTIAPVTLPISRMSVARVVLVNASPRWCTSKHRPLYTHTNQQH